MKQRIRVMVMLVVFSLGLISQPVQKASAADSETGKVYYVETQEDEYIVTQRAVANHEKNFTIRYLASKEEEFEYVACDVDYWLSMNDFYYSNPLYTKSSFIIKDCPSVDWSDGEYVTAKGQKWCSITYSYKFNENDDEYKGLYGEIDKLIRDSGIATASDYDKAAWAYDWICNNISYDYNFKNYHAYDTFVNKSGVCDGYAALFSIFAEELGLNCRDVSGLANGKYGWEAHAWDIIELDGKWYNVDSTWGANHGRKYFLSGTDNFSIDHKIKTNIILAYFDLASSDCNGSNQNSGVPASVYGVKLDSVNKERLNINEGYKWLINNPDNISLAFSSSDSSVASVDSKGMIKAVKAGKTTVQAVNTDLGIIQTCEITVSKEKALITDFTIVMSAKDVAVTYGKTAKMDLMLSESNGKLKDVKYTSADKKIATVDKNGKVKGVRAGTTNITVSYTGGEKVTVPVTVKPAIKTKKATVNSGDKISLKGAVTISKNGYKDLKFKTSNKKIAAVSSTGYVTGKAGGKCKISVYDKKTNKKVATVNVTVTAYETININDL